MKCKNLIWLFFLVFSSIKVNSQDHYFDWAKQFGGSSSDAGYALTTDASGNIYCAGIFSGTADFDPGPGILNLSTTANQGMFVLKLDTAGRILWGKQFNGSMNTSCFAKAITLSPNGLIIVTGGFSGTVDFDPGPGTNNLQSSRVNNLMDGYVLALDNNGNLSWVKQIAGTNASLSLLSYSITTDLQGNIFTTGVFYGQFDFDPGPAISNLTTPSLYQYYGFILKLDPSGNFIFAKAIGSASTSVTCTTLEVDPFGRLWYSGIFTAYTVGTSGNLDLNPGAGIFTVNVQPYASSTFIVRLDNTGQFEWGNSFNWASNDGIYDMVFDAQGDLFISGFCNQSAVDQILIAKLSSAGNLIWEKRSVGTDHAWSYSIALDEGRQIFVTGVFRGTTDFDFSAANLSLTSKGINDIFIASYDLSGNFLWVKEIGSPGTEYAFKTVMDSRKNLITTGYFEQTADFHTEALVQNLSSFGVNDVFIHKIKYCQRTFDTLTITACKTFTLNNVSYTTSGNYSQQLINTSGCDSLLNINLTINPVSTTNISKTICEGEFYDNHSATGIYTDIFNNSYGCDSIRTLNLTVIRKPRPDLGVEKNYCIGDSIILNPGNFIQYLWQDGSTSSTMKVDKPGIYKVTVTDVCGSAATEVKITNDYCDIYFPSGFTPDKNGLNDLFKPITNLKLPYFRLSIYNRWGEQIFQTMDVTKGWDGKIRGMNADAGVFIWYCEFKRPGATEIKSVKGTFILVR